MNPILNGAPWLIAHRSMLGINRPLKITLNGFDYVLWQNSNGEISALDNICPHMQAPLSNGWICESRNSITCPYHALEFDRKGRLLKDGERKGEPLAKQLELIVRDDLIWTVESTARIIEQDSSNVESLYPRQKPKIRLPKEELMSYLDKLYHNW